MKVALKKHTDIRDAPFLVNILLANHMAEVREVIITLQAQVAQTQSIGH